MATYIYYKTKNNESVRGQLFDCDEKRALASLKAKATRKGDVITEVCVCPKFYAFSADHCFRKLAELHDKEKIFVKTY